MKWLADAMRVMMPPMGSISVQAGINHLPRFTTGHAVKAAALALVRSPEDEPTVTLSVHAVGQPIAPLMKIKGAHYRPISKGSLDDLQAQIITAVDGVRSEGTQQFRRWRTVGRWIPFGWLRRLCTWLLLDRKECGDIQVSMLRKVDSGISTVFGAPLLLTVGCATPGLVTLTLCFDHSVYNGVDAMGILGRIKQYIEGPLE